MSSFDANKSRVAIIAGNGTLPFEIKQELDRLDRNPILIGISGEVDEALKSQAFATLTYGQLGRLFEILSKEKISYVIFAGGIRRRPDYSNMKMDLVTLKEVPRLLKILMGGDNSVLEKICKYFLDKKVDVVGAHQVVPSLLAPEGFIVGKATIKKIAPEINRAFEAAKTIGALDIGQAAIAEDGKVIALEAVEGTDQMIKRVQEQREKGRLSNDPKMSILAKVMKPQQDTRADLPSIGPQTIQAVSKAGLKGIVLEADRSLILSRDKTIKKAKELGIFIIGMKWAGE